MLLHTALPDLGKERILPAAHPLPTITRLPVLKLKVLCLGNSLRPKEIGIADHLLGVLLERVAFGRAGAERKDIGRVS